MAFSGGGDSTALLLLTHDWSIQARRRLIALTVDHRLQPQSPAWAKACGQVSARLGHEHRTLVWTADKPDQGLVAAARRARHALLAEAARDAGAAVILMGHTADDVLESEVMREGGLRTPSPRAFSPSPVWPQGRNVCLLRPLLGARRAQLRAVLAAHGETWIEDPANENLESARIRARSIAAARDAPSSERAPQSAPSIKFGPAGDLVLPRRAFERAPRSDARRWLSAALACASGREAPARAERIEGLLDHLAGDRPLAASLGGARVLADLSTLHLVRDPAERRAGGPPILQLSGIQDAVFDGRFAIQAREPARVELLRGRAAQLPPHLKEALRRAPASIRPALPLVTFTDGSAALPTLVLDARVEATLLAPGRFAAATGEIQHESATVRWRNARWAPSFEATLKRLDDEPS